jgi:hypothetical protein
VWRNDRSADGRGDYAEVAAGVTKQEFATVTTTMMTREVGGNSIYWKSTVAFSLSLC